MTARDLPETSQRFPSGGPDLDPETRALARELMARSARSMGVPDIMIWLADPERKFLLATLGTGPQATRFEGAYAQPVGEGLISVVFLTGQALCRNHVAADPSHSDQLDQWLGQHTQAMVVAPLRFGDAVAGVISCAAVSPLENPQPPRAFEAADLREIEFLAACVSRVISCDSRA